MRASPLKTITMTSKSYFSLSELCDSNTAKAKGIDNAPNEQVKANINALISNILNPLREAYGKPIVVSSGYRCAALNKIVGGAATSQHVLGQAADIHTANNTPTENKVLFDLVRSLKLPFDQLINEYGYKWVHVSFSPRNRRQLVTVK